jgi:hypothetical protein
LALARIALQPLITKGLSSPLYVTNAHDGINRLFIVEQPGRIRVLQPGATAPSVFLDITSKVLFGGERGLLGLAFHPQFAASRRLFVDYTRKPDGATVIAECRVSADDPNQVDPAESILLTIDQPYENHNGGMLEFGPDGFLYIGVGDGGSANDPGNRAQNPRELLGKILRIDVDRADPGKAYSSPPSNPYYGSGAGRDEIYALGLRNPWRFSFDRETGQLYAGDVGQDQIEEIDVITLGGNYGWRTFEGSRCTNLGPALCSAGAFLPPIAEYRHESGRCSITGGYVYRGSQASLPFGSYVYGDYCSGEIFLLSGDTQSVLMSGVNGISSFGEDESGEIYVVGINGTVHRIVNPDAPSKPTSYFPRLATTSAVPEGQSEYTGFAVTNFGADSADLTFTAYDSNGSIIVGTDINNPGSLTLPAGDQIALVDAQIFGNGIRPGNRLGWVKLQSSVREVAAFFLDFNADLTVLEGANAVSTTPSFVILPEVEARGTTQAHVNNPYPSTVSVILRLIAPDGSLRASANRDVGGNGSLIELAADLFPGVAPSSSDYIQVLAMEDRSPQPFPLSRRSRKI